MDAPCRDSSSACLASDSGTRGAGATTLSIPLARRKGKNPDASTDDTYASVSST